MTETKVNVEATIITEPGSDHWYTVFPFDDSSVIIAEGDQSSNPEASVVYEHQFDSYPPEVAETARETVLKLVMRANVEVN